MDRETADEIKRHFNVVAESLRSEIRGVAEGLRGFREEVSAEFSAVREEISEVNAMIRFHAPVPEAFSPQRPSQRARHARAGRASR